MLSRKWILLSVTNHFRVLLQPIVMSLSIVLNLRTESKMQEWCYFFYSSNSFVNWTYGPGQYKNNFTFWSSWRRCTRGWKTFLFPESRQLWKYFRDFENFVAPVAKWFSEPKLLLGFWGDNLELFKTLKGSYILFANAFLQLGHFS